MDLFFLRNFFSKVLERKKTLIFLALLVVLFTILGMCFLSSPAVYEYHLELCESFLLDVCFSDGNVFLIFLGRLGGCLLLVLLILIGGIHPAALVRPLFVIVYRAFTFGGCLYVFFVQYGLSGAMVVFVLYLPIHLLTDVLLLFAAVISFGRAFRFCFCGTDLFEILWDAFALLLLAVAVYLAEMILLLALFHPIGKIL